jgi:glucosamine-6-phosphate deaminase
LDEFGGLDPDDEGRTRNMLMDRLIRHVDLPRERFHSFALDGDVDDECRRYDAAVGGVFDLVVLGIGTNGHLGMNEPGSSAASPTRRVELNQSTIASSARYFTHDRLPTWGVTVGLAAILAAREVWVLATGSSKAAIIRRTVQGEVSEEVPASLLRNHRHCSLFVDAEAGALL